MHPSRRLAVRLALAALLALPSLVRAAPVVRSDSTITDAWRLENGLEVRTLSIPRAAGVSVTLAFRAGSGYEPAGRDGLSELLAELQFMSAAGEVPERTREEMASLRPLGWEIRTGARLVRFTELASAAQLPGVLRQVAARLGGVRVTDADVKAALANVRRDRGTRCFGDPGGALYWRPPLLARGLTDEQLVRTAGMPELGALTARDVAPLLEQWYHAGNASLALAGDLSRVDVHALVRSLFAPLPGGPAMPDTVRQEFRAAVRAATWKGLASPVGVIAVRAPALTDTLHAGFYLGMLITGPGLTSLWGRPGPPLTSRFQYSLFDDPEIVRFYPPVPAATNQTEALTGAFKQGLQQLSGQIVDLGIVDRVRRNVRWLLGGELPDDVLDRLRREASGLGTLSDAMAARALWKGDAFWRTYLRRFDTTWLGHTYYYEWLANRQHEITLLLTPAR